MKTFDIAKRAWRSLKNAKARTILTSLAIAVGAFTITVSLAAGEGARQYADKLISANVNPRAMFIVQDKTLFEGGAQASGLSEYDPDGSVVRAGVSIKQMTQEGVDALIARNDLEYVVPIYNPKIKYLTFEGNEKKFSATVTTYDSTVTVELSSGVLPESGKQLADTEALIPQSFVQTLIDKGVAKNEQELIGKRIVMTATKATPTLSADQVAAAFARGGQAAVQALTAAETKDFTFVIKGIAKRSAAALTGSTDIQVSAESAKTISEYTTQGTDSYQKYVGVTALVRDGFKPDEVKDALVREGFAAQTAKDLQGVIFTIVNTLQGIVLGFGVVALIASVFGIINTQYISVLERTREIGLMKALGMRGRSVSRLFQFEAAWIGFLGGIIGAAIAASVGTALNPWITDTLDLGEGTYLLIFQPIPIGMMILGLILIAMLAGWFPARKAAKLDPIEALRTE